MRFTTLTILLLLFTVQTHAQDYDNIFTIVEDMPYFGVCPEDEQNCFKLNFFPFIEVNLEYPRNHPKGVAKIRTYMKFVVDPDGVVSGIEIAKSSGYSEFDKSATAVIQKLPTFVPGKHKGETVSVQYLVPIDFFYESETFPIENDVPYAADDKGEVFSIVEKMPLFGTCKKENNSNDQFANYYKQQYECSVANIEKYIQEEVSKLRSGLAPGYYKVLVQFVIEKDGQLTYPSIKQSSGNESIDAAAYKIISQMDAWTGGTQRGIPVRVQYILPVQFK